MTGHLRDKNVITVPAESGFEDPYPRPLQGIDLFFKVSVIVCVVLQ